MKTPLLHLDAESNEEPVVLYDPLEAFRDWVAILFTLVYKKSFWRGLTLTLSPLRPLDSCLSPHRSSRTNLGRLLALLLLCHKYLATKIEAFVLPITEPLVGTWTLRPNISDDLTPFRVVEVAHSLNQPVLATAARCLILQDLWGSNPGDIFATLLFGECVNDQEIDGVAYYQILRSFLASLDS